MVAVALAAGRVLGMVREMVVAARFGTGETYDAYVAAFRIPDFLFVIVMSGAFGAAFLPVFSGFLGRGETDRAWVLANALMTWTVMILAVLALVVFAFAEPIVTVLVAPELQPDGQELAVELTRMLLFSPLLLGLGAAAKGMLEAQDQFTVPALAPIVYNLGIIAGAVALAPSMGIHGLVIGVLVGALGNAGTQFVALFRDGLVLRPVLSPRTPGLREVALLVGPRLAGYVVAHSNLIVVTNLASRAGLGAISALSYGQSLVMLPHGVLAMSLATVIFPRMSRQFALGRLDDMRAILARALRPLLFLSLPAMVLLVALRVSIVQVLFQYGTFGPDSTDRVANAVAWLALGLLARILIEPLTRAFYAMHDTRTPLAVSAMSVALNVGLGWLLLDRFGLTGIAFSLSLTYTLRMAALLAVISSRLGGVSRELAAALARIVPAVAALAVAAWLSAAPLARLTDPETGRDFLDYLAFTASLVLLGALYLAAAFMARTPELIDVTDRIRRRLR